MLGDSVRRRQRGRGTGRGTARGGRSDGGGSRWRMLWVAIPLALAIPLVAGYLIAVYVLFPPTEVSAAGIPVPDLVGQQASEAQRLLAEAGLGALEAEQLPHPDAPSGEVVAQSPLPGQQLRPGAGVRVALSSGPPRALVPDVIGYSDTRAESLLRRAGFEVAKRTEESSAPEGRVLRTEPQPGQERMLPAFVTVIVSEGPPGGLVPAGPPDVPGGIRPDTLGSRPDTLDNRPDTLDNRPATPGGRTATPGPIR